VNRIHLLNAMSQKSTHTAEYAELLRLLIDERQARGLTQVHLAQRLPFPQPVISKIERGERRLDVIELRLFCAAIGIPLVDFVRKLEERLARGKGAG